MTDENSSAPNAGAASDFLSLSQAVGMMAPPEERQAETPAPQQREPARAPETPASAQDDDEQPQQQETTTEEGEAEEETLPPIDPPPFWKKAARELFASLPRDAQEAIVERERERDSGVNKALEESASERRKAEAARMEAERERTTYSQRLETLIPALQSQLASEFADIRTPADAAALAQQDPARWALWRSKQDALGSAYAEQQQQTAIAQRQAEQARQEAIRKEFDALTSKRPDLKDPVKREKLNSELRAYAVEAGYTPEQYDSNMSHLNLLMLEKAMLYDRAQRARANAVEKPLPKVTRPGTAPATRQQRLADQRTQQLEKLSKTGSLDDAIGLLRG